MENRLAGAAAPGNDSVPEKARWAFLLFIVVACVHLVALAGIAGGAGFGAPDGTEVTVPWAEALAWWTKPLLMVTLLLWLLAASPARRSESTVLTSVALVCSLGGDVAIRENFILGLLCFLLAHLVYLPLMWRSFSGRIPRWSVLYAVWFVVFLVVLTPYLGDLFVPVLIYGAVLLSMAATASRGGVRLAFGGGLFALSDTVLALNRFLPELAIPLPSLLIMTTYISAQALIVAAVLRSQRSSAPPP